MSWVIFNPNVTDIETFVKEKAPSKVSREDGYAWIYVKSNTRSLTMELGERDDDGDEDEDEDDEDEDMDGILYKDSKLKRDWKALCKFGSSAVTYQAVCELAKANRCRKGKWLVYEQLAKVDKVWADIARATVEGNLGIAAKVSTRVVDNIPVICVYNEDFTDRDSVLNLEKGLRRLGIGTHLNYKPDIYTYLGIYAKNKWNIKPTICTSKYDFDKKQWNVQFTNDKAARGKSQTKLTFKKVPRPSTSHQSDAAHPSSQNQEPPHNQSHASKRAASDEKTEESTKIKVPKV